METMGNRRNSPTVTKSRYSIFFRAGEKPLSFQHCNSVLGRSHCNDNCTVPVRHDWCRCSDNCFMHTDQCGCRCSVRHCKGKSDQHALRALQAQAQCIPALATVLREYSMHSVGSASTVSAGVMNRRTKPAKTKLRYDGRKSTSFQDKETDRFANGVASVCPRPAASSG